MKVAFTERFDWSPPALRGTVTTAYEAGQTYTVTHECAAAAEAAGVGSVVRDEPDPKPRRRKQ